MKLTAIILGFFITVPLYSAEQPAPESAAPQPQPAKAPEEPTGTKAEQLAAAQKQLAVMRLRHDEKHPVIIKQRAKIARLHKEVRAEEAEKAPLDPAGQLAAARQELATLREKFTDEHPAVIAQQRRVGELEQRR